MAGPILRWAGSKQQLVPAIVALAPKNYVRYIEPFAGSGCVFASLEPKVALISDINPDLIDAYRIIRDHADAVFDEITTYPLSSKSYYAIREIPPDCLEPITRAARFVYLNRHCFNGVYRTNQRGQFNVPIGTRTGHLPSKEAFRTFASLLARAKLRACDFQEAMADCQAGDFAYLDPPYVRGAVRFRGEYGKEQFTSEDEDRFVDALGSVSRRGVHIVVSYSESLTKRLPGWKVTSQTVLRSVAGFGVKRKKVLEFLYTNAHLIQKD